MGKKTFIILSQVKFWLQIFKNALYSSWDFVRIFLSLFYLHFFSLFEFITQRITFIWLNLMLGCFSIARNSCVSQRINTSKIFKKSCNRENRYRCNIKLLWFRETNTVLNLFSLNFWHKNIWHKSTPIKYKQIA